MAGLGCGPLVESVAWPQAMDPSFKILPYSLLVFFPFSTAFGASFSSNISVSHFHSRYSTPWIRNKAVHRIEWQQWQNEFNYTFMHIGNWHWSPQKTRLVLSEMRTCICLSRLRMLTRFKAAFLLFTSKFVEFQVTVSNAAMQSTHTGVCLFCPPCNLLTDRAVWV